MGYIIELIIGGVAMGLFQTHDNALTGNSIKVGDLVITWDDSEDSTLELEPTCDMPGDKEE